MYPLYGGASLLSEQIRHCCSSRRLSPAMYPLYGGASLLSEQIRHCCSSRRLSPAMYPLYGGASLLSEQIRHSRRFSLAMYPLHGGTPGRLRDHRRSHGRLSKPPLAIGVGQPVGAYQRTAVSWVAI